MVQWLRICLPVQETWVHNPWRHGFCPGRFNVLWGSCRQQERPRPEHWSGWPFLPPGDLPNPGIEPRSPRLQADSSPAEPPGKPQNTGVGNLSILQQVFPTQELNRDLQHCRWILHQLSYQGSLPGKTQCRLQTNK